MQLYQLYRYTAVIHDALAGLMPFRPIPFNLLCWMHLFLLHRCSQLTYESGRQLDLAAAARAFMEAGRPMEECNREVLQVRGAIDRCKAAVVQAGNNYFSDAAPLPNHLTLIICHAKIAHA